MSKIFISYAGEDVEFLNIFVKEVFSKTGIKPWYYTDGEQARIGEDLIQTIIDKIDECEVLIFLISSSSQDKKWCKKEIHYALEINKTIFPIIIDNCQLTGWVKFLFNDKVYINYNKDNECENFYKSLANKFLQHSKTMYNTCSENLYDVVYGKDISRKDIEEAIDLDKLSFSQTYWVDIDKCLKWFEANSYIYFMLRDKGSKKIIAYINAMPVTDECYNDIRNGNIIGDDILPENIMSDDMPCSCNVYFCSIVIHPQHRNTGALVFLVNAIINRIIKLGERQIYIKRMLADAVTSNGMKLCKLFGMKKVIETTHNSYLYEVRMIPPEFNAKFPAAYELKTYYESVFNKFAYLFQE